MWERMSGRTVHSEVHPKHILIFNFLTPTTLDCDGIKSHFHFLSDDVQIRCLPQSSRAHSDPSPVVCRLSSSWGLARQSEKGSPGLNTVYSTTLRVWFGNLFKSV